MNYFEGALAAERYARYRPYFHPLVVERLGLLTGRVGVALDVGCGTGQSTVALMAIADEVVGVDRSEEMLLNAKMAKGATYKCASAEALPFADSTFDLVTSGLAFHWFDQPKFLKEAARVLRPGGWLSVYDDGFTGVMLDNPDYERWNRERYLARFPSPARNLRAAEPSDWLAERLAHVDNAKFTHDVAMSPDALCGYLMTQTNVIAALDSGRESIDVVATWLMSETGPFFSRNDAGFKFYCNIDIYQLEA
jgi:SAM-dependent methyltransferase